MSKIYRYKNQNEWSEKYTLSEILNLVVSDDTLIWWEGICPKNHLAETCIHSVTLADVKKNNKGMLNNLKPTNSQREI